MRHNSVCTDGSHPVRSGFSCRQRAVHMVAYTVHVNDTIRLSAPAVIKEIEVPVPVDVDTAAILQQYFTKRSIMIRL